MYIEYTWKNIWNGRVIEISRMIESTKEQVASYIYMEEGGFRSGRGCIDQIFVMKQVVEKHREKRKELHDAFMDLEKVYDKVCREALWRVLHECGVVDGYLIRGMNSLYNGSRACVRLGSRVREYSEVWKGLRQVCVMSPCLFNIFLTEW